MEEIEAPMESVEETIHHEAHAAKENWFSQVAMSSAVFAVFAAVSALISNHHANEAMIDQIKASDHWGYYQAKGIKAGLLSTKTEVLSSLGKSISEKDEEKIRKYRKEQDQIAEEAHEREQNSEIHLKHHVILARSVTMFQIAIAIAAITLLTRKKRYWLVSLGFAAIGLAFLVQGLFLVV